MNSMTSAGPTANSVFVAAPQNPYPTMPGAMSQGPLYPWNQPQVHLIPGNPPGPEPSACVRPDQRGLKEGKVLGAIQILIGLVHIGLGFVMATLLRSYQAFSFYKGFPFWGGIWFIISGSLSVSAEKQPKSPSLVKCSLGFNIVSVIYSVTGMIFFIIDMSSNSLYVYTDYYIHWSLTPGMAVSSVLLIFCLLEFCIACTAINFGCQLVYYSHNHVSMVLPNVYVATSTVIPEPANPPPTYSTEVQGSK